MVSHSREGLLQEVDIVMPIVRIRHGEHTYICFIPLNRSFDVTSDETCAASGIEIVDRIVAAPSAIAE